jgi:hypothetical protein
MGQYKEEVVRRNDSSPLKILSQNLLGGIVQNDTKRCDSNKFLAVILSGDSHMFSSVPFS